MDCQILQDDMNSLAQWETNWPMVFTCFLFDLMLYVRGKQLRSCRDGQLLNHTVPGQVSRRQYAGIKYWFFHQLLTTYSS